METTMLTDACNVCESINIYYSKEEDIFICDTCGHNMTEEQITCKCINLKTGRIMKALITALVLLANIVSFSQKGIINVTIVTDSSIYMQGDTLNIDSSKTKYVRIKGGVADNWANTLKGGHDTIGLPVGNLMSFEDFKRLYPLWNSTKNLYKMNNGTTIVMNGDTMRTNMVMWSMMMYNDSKGYVFLDSVKRSNVHVRVIPIGKGGVIQLPDMQSYKLPKPKGSRGKLDIENMILLGYKNYPTYISTDIIPDDRFKKDANRKIHFYDPFAGHKPKVDTIHQISQVYIQLPDQSYKLPRPKVDTTHQLSQSYISR